MMKKGIEWLKEAIGELDLVDTVFDVGGVSYIDTAVRIMQVYDLIDQLDEPEVLSQEWIDKNKFEVNGWNEAVHVEDLQNLLVPKWEELETKIHELIESYKQEYGAYSNPENGWISGFVEDLENLVEEEQKYYVRESNYLLCKWKNEVIDYVEALDREITDLVELKLTEQEIKDYDERYWAFAEPIDKVV